MSDIALDINGNIITGLNAPVSFGGVSVSVAGGADVTLTVDQFNKGIIELTGLLTANINVIFPVGFPYAPWKVRNKSTGAFTITVKATSGTGFTVTQGKCVDIYFDGTNMVPGGAESAT